MHRPQAHVDRTQRTQSIPSKNTNTKIIKSILIFDFELSEMKKKIADIVYPAFSKKLHGTITTAKSDAENENGMDRIQSMKVATTSGSFILARSAKNVPKPKPSKIAMRAMRHLFIGEQIPSMIAPSGSFLVKTFIFLSVIRVRTAYNQTTSDVS